MDVNESQGRSKVTDDPTPYLTELSQSDALLFLPPPLLAAPTLRVLFMILMILYSVFLTLIYSLFLVTVYSAG